VELLVLVAALVGTFGIAFGVSRLVLGFALNAMAGQVTVPAVGAPWRRVALLVGLFVLLYLVPGLAAAAVRSPAVVVVRHLLGH
jgi:hypothetical protein